MVLQNFSIWIIWPKSIEDEVQVQLCGQYHDEVFWEGKQIKLLQILVAPLCVLFDQMIHIWLQEFCVECFERNIFY